MNKTSIFLILILMLFCCQEKDSEINFKNELRGKTFNVLNHENYPLDFEFKDSIYSAYQFKKISEQYRIKTINDTTYLVLGINSYLNLITKSENDLYDYLIISQKFKDTLQLKEKKAKWNIDKIYGKWFEEKQTHKELDSIPYYSINATEIVYYKNFGKIKSEIEVNSTHEYIEMNLIHSQKRTETLWKINNLTDSSMVIDRVSHSSPTEYGVRNNLKLIKKR